MRQDFRDKIQKEVDLNYEFFTKELSKLLLKHLDKYALLRHQAIIKYFDSFEDAKKYAKKTYSDRLYSIQKVEKNTPIHLGFLGEHLYA
jgi:hypothetical protein